MPNAHDGYIALISVVTNEEAHHPNFIAWTPLVFDDCLVDHPMVEL